MTERAVSEVVADLRAIHPTATGREAAALLERLDVEDQRMTAALADFMREQTRLQKQVAYREEEIARLQAMLALDARAAHDLLPDCPNKLICILPGDAEVEVLRAVGDGDELPSFVGDDEPLRIVGRAVPVTDSTLDLTPPHGIVRSRGLKLVVQ